jgi:hypothetical protein
MVWPALGGGYLLYRDFITVPDPALDARTWGFNGTAPRAVPLNAVMALLDPVVPTWLQQKAILVGSLWVAGAGVALLLRRRGVLVAALGALLATWSPFAAERLLLGQAPTLLAWSVLPWLVLASQVSRSPRVRVFALALAALPAALTPSGGVTAAAAAVVLTWLAGRRVVEVLTVAGLGVLWCLPWLVPALAGRADAGVSDGAAAFRIEANGVAGLLDVLTGGGAWATAARLESRERLLTLGALALLLLLASLGLARPINPRRRLMGLFLLAPPAVAVFLASPVGLRAFAAAQSIPGVALFRDTHRLLAVSAFALVLLVPLGTALVVERARELLSGVSGRASGGRPTSERAQAAVAVGLTCVVAATAVLAAPDVPARLHAAYRPVAFPPDWRRAVGAVGGSGALVLPWQPLRQVAWNDDRPFLDPLPLALRGDVVSAADLTVQRSGETFRVGASDPAASANWVEGRLNVTDLRGLGVDVVVEWLGTPGRPVDTQQLRLIFAGTSLRVWSVT